MERRYMGVMPMTDSGGTARPLSVDLTQMAAHVEKQLDGAIRAFERRDLASAQEIIAADARIDLAHSAIEQKVMDALSLGPQSARHLREIMMTMKVAGELERVGDLAKNVAKRTLVVSRERFVTPANGVVRMGDASLRQLSRILNALADENQEAAEAVWRGDDDLDALYNSVFKEIILEMMGDRDRINACLHMVFIAKNFERVGDHATNIAEALYYFITGASLAIDRP
ncbi:MAG: phosphate signaling complex protein PhoU, partial [Pseudomonadota bacterium]